MGLDEVGILTVTPDSKLLLACSSRSIKVLSLSEKKEVESFKVETECKEIDNFVLIFID